jgi:hypothetical protein
MTIQYSPKAFLRQAPNGLLARYFDGQGVLAEVNIATLDDTAIDPVYDAWSDLPAEVRTQVDADFRDIEALANEAGTRTLLEEARFHDEDLEPLFAEMDGFYDRAFWAFLERREVFDVALRFRDADNLPARYWRKRKGVPQVPPSVDEANISKFEQAISFYFREREGRGHSCKIDVYRRGDREYFFVYLADYGRTSIEWEASGLARRPHRPAFEIIFVYAQNAGTLDIFLEGPKKKVQDLQEIFARVILNTELGDPVKDERVYELNVLKRRDFQFIYEPTSGIRDVRVKKLRLSTLGAGRRITLEDDPSMNRAAVYDLLDEVVQTADGPTCDTCRKIPLALVNVTLAGIQVHFEPDGKRGRRTRTFQISYPNSCALAQDGRDALIRKMLADSGIDVVQDTSEPQGA